MQASRSKPWAARVVSGILLVGAGSTLVVSPANAEGSEVLQPPASTSTVWIDVEDIAADSGAIFGTLQSPSFTTPLDFASTPNGFTAVADSFPDEFSLAVASEKPTDARISVTFVADDGTILAESSTETGLLGGADVPTEPSDPTAPAEPTPSPEPTETIPMPQPTDPSADNGQEASASASNENGTLSSTGARVAIFAVLAIGLLAGGAALLRGRQNGDVR